MLQDVLRRYDMLRFGYTANWAPSRDVGFQYWGGWRPLLAEPGAWFDNDGSASSVWDWEIKQTGLVPFEFWDSRVWIGWTEPWRWVFLDNYKNAQNATLYIGDFPTLLKWNGYGVYYNAYIVPNIPIPFYLYLEISWLNFIWDPITPLTRSYWQLIGLEGPIPGSERPANLRFEYSDDYTTLSAKTDPPDWSDYPFQEFPDEPVHAFVLYVELETGLQGIISFYFGWPPMADPVWPIHHDWVPLDWVGPPTFARKQHCWGPGNRHRIEPWDGGD